MFLGYNTNGLAHHDLFDAVELLAEIGYRGVAITIDHNALPPGDPSQIDRLRLLLEKLNMRSAIETGARFLLDPRLKHEPTLLSDDPRPRIDFYKYAVDVAAELGSDCVSLWSGVLHTTAASSRRVGQGRANSWWGCANQSTESQHIKAKQTDLPRPKPHQKNGLLDPPYIFDDGPSVSVALSNDDAMRRLVAGLREVLDYAAEKNVLIAFEPEPGMLIDTTAAFERLLEQIDSPNLRLTLDIGHLHCQGETPIADVIRRWAPRLANVHIEDMRRGRHEHLMFSDGEIDFPPVVEALNEINYASGVYVELSRHSHEGPASARRAFEFLQNCNSRN